MASTTFDGQEVSTHHLQISDDSLNQRTKALEIAKNKFNFFIRDWKTGNSYPYREQLLSNANIRAPLLKVDLSDLQAHDSRLYQDTMSSPDDYLKQFEEAAQEAYLSFNPRAESPPFQVCLVSHQRTHMLRELHSDMIGQVIIAPAIVVAASKPSVKATTLRAQCKNCAHRISIDVQLGLGGVTLPRVCNAPRPQDGMGTPKCPLDPFVILPDESAFIDQQMLKLQERPEDVPTGDMPRTVSATVDRYLVDSVSPGSRVTILAIFSVFGGREKATLRNSYLRVVGVMLDDSEKSRFRHFYSPEDEETFYAMSREPDIYSKLASSIAPAVFGNTDIKKAISCLLFGGSRKVLPEGMSLRGDINVLLLGDPSTAKSQLLKFVGRTAPIAVCTSGKGSSASGLTASVVRDPSSREFQLEGGAMVLADGGVVCIDEFDKMRPEDRVAIHEAMEQQTISVAKAGITTILNSRTSVLAAANPIHGSYDDFKQAQEQIDLQTTILSRFDCIFLVRDIRNEEHDKQLASHVVNLHMGNVIPLEETAEIDISLLKKYIAFAKQKCQPRLTPQTAEILQNYYVADRKKQDNGAFPITVRQLEAIIRLAESMAKVCLSDEVKPEHVEEAHRLFEVSTLSAASAGLGAAGVSIPREMAETVVKIEEAIRRRVAVGTRVTKERLEQELNTLFADSRAIDLALMNMIKREELQQLSGWKVIKRIR